MISEKMIPLVEIVFSGICQREAADPKPILKVGTNSCNIKHFVNEDGAGAGLMNDTSKA